jgi:hypothetical protein
MTKVLAVFLFLKVRVTKVIRKKGTNEVHPKIEDQKEAKSLKKKVFDLGIVNCCASSVLFFICAVLHRHAARLIIGLAIVHLPLIYFSKGVDIFFLASALLLSILAT